MSLASHEHHWTSYIMGFHSYSYSMKTPHYLYSPTNQTNPWPWTYIMSYHNLYLKLQNIPIFPLNSYDHLKNFLWNPEKKHPHPRQTQERRARCAVPGLRLGTGAGSVGLRSGGCNGVTGMGRGWGWKNHGKTMEKSHRFRCYMILEDLLIICF
jgi:hypothetical protein